jgi:hypothetical protein
MRYCSVVLTSGVIVPFVLKALIIPFFLNFSVASL